MNTKAIETLLEWTGKNDFEINKQSLREFKLEPSRGNTLIVILRISASCLFSAYLTFSYEELNQAKTDILDSSIKSEIEKLEKAIISRDLRV